MGISFSRSGRKTTLITKPSEPNLVTLLNGKLPFVESQDKMPKVLSWFKAGSLLPDSVKESRKSKAA